MSLVLAAVTYFLANTAPVASIIGLTEGGNPFRPLAQGVLVVLPELRNRRGIDCNRFRLHHRQRPGHHGSSHGSSVRCLSAQKTYVSQAQQTQPKAMTMAMSAGR